MISLLIPTRERPNLLKQTIESAYSTVSDIDNLHIALYIDNDEDDSIEVVHSFEDKYNIDYYQAERTILSNTYNILYDKFKCGDIVFFGGDDLVFKTKDWDLVVERAFNQYPDRILLAYGDDEWVKHDFGTHGFLSKEVVETVGYVLPPYFYGEFADTWWDRIMSFVGRKQKLPIIVTHYHYSPGLREFDKTDQSKFERQRSANAEQVFNDKHEERVEDAKKLLDEIKRFKNSDSN